MTIESVMPLSKEMQLKVINKMKFALGDVEYAHKDLQNLIESNPLVLAALAVTSPSLTLWVPKGFVQYNDLKERVVRDYFSCINKEHDYDPQPLYKSLRHTNGDTFTMIDMFMAGNVYAVYDSDLHDALERTVKALKTPAEVTDGSESKKREPAIRVDQQTGDYIFNIDQWFVNSEGVTGRVAKGTVLPYAMVEGLTFYDDLVELNKDTLGVVGEKELHELWEELMKVSRAQAGRPIVIRFK